jgi:hypothetical protein
MDPVSRTQILVWPAWRKFIFCFLFIFLGLQIAPWLWLSSIPGISKLSEYYSLLMDWAVNTANAKLFHVKKVLVPLNGSGDTSYGWAQLWLFLSVALAGSIIWRVADRKRPNYHELNYWLCLFVRYYVALIAFVYGIEKIFALQMYFPNMSQLATPLGDLLPMRFSWLFIGYSTPYQVFSGIMETTAGLLLLYRRTATFGILMATAVFINVMMLNLCYDIPVKIFSMQIVFMCLFLVANEFDRIICFFILNKPAASSGTYDRRFPKRWMRITRIVLKSVFILVAVVWQINNMWEYYKSTIPKVVAQPIRTGVYDVAVYALNKDSIPFSPSDSLRWKDVIFDVAGAGSVKSADTLFRQRYRRGYFSYSADTLNHLLTIKKFPGDSIPLLLLRYEIPDSNTVFLRGRQRTDSLYVVLKRTNRHFQLAEKQFHWLSEANR